MYWLDVIEKNRERNGDPITALYLPDGEIIASGFDITEAAIRWIMTIAYGDRPIPSRLFATGTEVSSLESLHSYAKMAAKTGDVTDLHFVDTQNDGASFRAMNHRDGWRAVLTIRPHLPQRDNGRKEGPPIVGISWNSDSLAATKSLRLPKSLANSLYRTAYAWPDTTRTELTTVMFSLEGAGELPTDPKWDVLGLRWSKDSGGVVTFPTKTDTRHFVTLPHGYAQILVKRLGHLSEGGRALVGDASLFLEDAPPAVILQRFN